MKVMIKAIVRPEKVNAVMAALMESGYPAVHPDECGRTWQAAGDQNR